MPNKYHTLFFMILLAATAAAQPAAQNPPPNRWGARYILPTPTGWGSEQFDIPIGFAPQIPYTGTEHIRFMPNWGKIDSAAYWSYVFLWDLDGIIKLNADSINKNLGYYFTGLFEVNNGDISPKKPTQATASFKKIRTQKNDKQTYAGTVLLTNYMTGKPMKLYGKIHLKNCAIPNKTLILYEFSPQLPTHAVWQSLDKLCNDFLCR